MTQHPAHVESDSAALQRVLQRLHGGFVVSGMATTLLGPMMPLLMTRWSLSDASAGILFTTQFAGQSLATFTSSAVAARIGDRLTLACGAAVVAVGVAGLALASWPLATLAALVYGLGLGLVLPTTNFVVAALRPADSAAALNLLNVSWGIGAVTWPLVVATSLAVAPSDRAPLTILSVAMAVLALVLWRSSDAWPARATAVSRQAAAPRSQMHTGAFWSLVAGLAATSFLLVGIEASIGGWIAEFTRRAGSSGRMWALAATAFWGAETLGRLLAPLALRRVAELPMLIGGSILAAVALVPLVSGVSGVETAFVCAMVAGLGMAPTFPLLLAAMSRQIAPTAPWLMGPLFAMGGLGGATVPWVVGMVSSAAGTLEAGLLVPLGGLIAVVVLQMLARQSAHRLEG